MAEITSMQFRHISIDSVSESARCVYCGRKALCYLLVIGGSRHNQGGCFCESCKTTFLATLHRSAEYKLMLIDVQAPQTGLFLA